MYFRPAGTQFHAPRCVVNVLTIIFTFSQINGFGVGDGFMADTVTCPHCKGTGATYVIGNRDGRPALEPVTCVICDGKGFVAAPTLPAPAVAPSPGPAPVPPIVVSPETWPILVPLVIFSLFFLFLLF
jgi:hypothetical protein